MSSQSDIITTIGRFDRVAKGLVPEQIMPSQFWGNKPRDVDKPEVALVSAVLEQAWHDLRLGMTSRNRPQLFQDTCEWFLDESTEAQHWVFSFVNVCEILGMDADRIRTRVATLIATSQRMALVPTLSPRQQAQQRRQPLWRGKPLRARKQWRCALCWQDITPGELYIAQRKTTDPKTAHKRCLDAKKAREEREAA